MSDEIETIREALRMGEVAGRTNHVPLPEQFRAALAALDRLRAHALDLSEATIERVAIALWRVDWPEDGQFSKMAPNDWSKWPETPRQASLAYTDHSRQEYRDQAMAALSAAIERAKQS